MDSLFARVVRKDEPVSHSGKEASDREREEIRREYDRLVKELDKTKEPMELQPSREHR